MEFTQVIEGRYSCKNFSARQLAPAQLDAILAAGRVAPTAKNLQEQRIYVIQSAQGLAKIDAATPCRYGAPTCLVVAFDRSNVFTYPGGKRDSGVEDASIVATHLMLAAANAAAEPQRPQAADRDGPVSVTPHPLSAFSEVASIPTHTLTKEYPP